MTVRKQKVKYPPEFCFECGATLEHEKLVLNLGSSGSTYEFCRTCMRKIAKRATAALAAK